MERLTVYGRVSRGLLLLALVAALCAAPAPARGAQRAEPDTAAIDAYVLEQMRADRVPGVALAIVRGDKVVYARGYGEDGRGRPVTPETGFILGSMSKSFTALAVMQLVEQGVVELDAPARRYLPWFRLADPDTSERITVRHLLQHTSGIPGRARQAQGPDATLQDHVRALADVGLNAEPGVRHEYASPNYLVLGAIIEQVSGQPYAEYVRERIFAPLDMRNSFTDQEVAVRNGMANGHRYWFGFPVPTTLEHEHGRTPTAALISSAGDLGRYLMALLNEGRYDRRAVLSPQGVAELVRPGAPGDGFSYAMGWRVGPVEGVPAVHHGGIVPHFRGKMVMLPKQGWGVVVLTNASTSLPLPVVPTSHRMADAIAASLVGQPLQAGGYSQGIVYLGITAGMGLVLLSQAGQLARLGRWRAGLAGRSRRALLGEIVLELFWPIAALAALPALLGLPWSEIMRGTPDMAWWLIASVALSLLTGVAKAAALPGYALPRRQSAR
jgi:CubicO group peptidase (beta-lactamase class C family)